MEICFETIKLDMEKLKKAFVYALIVTVVINGFGFFVAVINSSLESTITDFKRIGLLTISIFFIPAFLSVLFYKKNVFSKGLKGISHFLIPSLISFITVYLIVYFKMLSNIKPSILDWEKQ